MRYRISLALLLAAAGPASAHVMLAQPSAAPGARYVAQFRVGHGCSGSPTIGLQVEIPPSVSAVTPDIPQGWSLAMVRAGGRITLVTWKGGSIPADKPGMFTIAMTLPAAPGMLVFPATQICEKGTEQWADLPAVAGAPPPKHPAPVLTVSPTPGPNPMPGMPAGMKMPE